MASLGSSTAVATVPTSSSVAAAPSPSSTFTFQPVPELFTCGLATIRWSFVGTAGPLTLNISNINIPQASPLSLPPVSSASSTPATVTGRSLPGKRQYNGYGGSYLPPIDAILIAGIDPTVGNWTWNGVNVPQGWYQMLAYVQGVLQTSSSSFFVQNGTNTNCVTQFGITPSNQAASSTLARPSPSPSAIVAASSHSHAGAIAGGVVGGVAFLAAAIIALLYFCTRRRSKSSRLRDEDGMGRRWSELSFRKSRPASGARSSIQKTVPGLVADRALIGSDDVLGTLGHEKALVATLPPVLPSPVLPSPISYNQSPRVSTQTNHSYPRTTSNPEPVVRRASYNPQIKEAIPLERTNTTGGGPRRKPAPRYEGADEPEVGLDGRSSSQTTLDSLHANVDGSPGGTHILQHQSSFGAMRPMHVMIPDPPPQAHS
ncbi:hypothetical protein F5148DRAFT_152615 [Russula earlei]|uniref:Uncharacterized protein n=1 Tax=Russula earlei TaxID=71964 RepID=A0ACC0U7S8_9AGAM|nr:hypothetical protein F5148DRAFT_152615 [Russula earlei]